MGQIRSLLDRFFAPQPMVGMVAARIGVGLILFFCYATKFRVVQSLYGPDGVGGAALYERAPGFPLVRPLESGFQLLLHVDSPLVIHALWAVLALSSLAFAVGWATRWTGALALVLHVLFHARNPYAYTGWAVMVIPWLLYLVLSRVGDFASVDAWIRRRRGSPGPGPARSWLGAAWPVRLIQVHVCLLYAMAGGARLVDPDWQQGRMVFHILNDRWYARLHYDFFPWIDVLEPLSLGVFVLEPLAPILLWTPIGPWWALLLVGMHAGMEALTNAGWWQPLMMVMLAVFLRPSWVAPLFGDFGRRGGRRRAAAAQGAPGGAGRAPSASHQARQATAS